MIIFLQIVQGSIGEASEDVEKELLMFDTIEDKQQTKTHVKEALPALEQRLKVESMKSNFSL